MPFSAAEATKRWAKSASTGLVPTRKRPRSASPSGVLTRALSARIRSHGLSTPRLTDASKQPPPETSRYAKPALSRISASRSCSAAGTRPASGSCPSRRIVVSASDGTRRSLPRKTRASCGAFLLEPSGDRPCAFAGVREQRPRQEAFLVVDGHEHNPRVAAVEPDGTSAGRKPEAEPVAAIRARRASLPEHLHESLLKHDRAREERAPERRHVRGGRVDAAVAASDHRQVEDVPTPRPLDLHVSHRRAPRELVRAEEGRVTHPRGRADQVPDEVGERPGRHPLRDQGEQDVAAVAVGEALAGRELLRVTVENFEIRLGRRKLLSRDWKQVLREVQIELLVEVVADPRPVREQVLDGDALVDEREIGA